MRTKWVIGCVLLFLTQFTFSATLLVVGDSISAGFGLDTKQGWVYLLQQRLHDQGYDYQVVNASVSGETTTGGLARLPALLKQHQPSLVVIELGGNDGLRAQPLTTMQENFLHMITLSQQAQAKVLLLGMRLPPNYGAHYTSAFADIFTNVAQQKNVALVPFLLEGVAGYPNMTQSDGIHPTASAQPIMLELVWPVLQPLL